MNVLITGGAGYIGSHCNKLFFRKGINTVVLDNLLFGHQAAVKYGQFVQGDFGDRELVKSILSQNKIDAVVHFAALADVNDSVRNPGKYYKNNVSRMIDLLDVMVDCSVQYFVFSSSASVYGEPQCKIIDECHPQSPISPYGETKLIGERLLAYYEKAYGIKCAAMRYFNASGADAEGEIGEVHHPEHHLLPLLFQTALRQRGELLVYGNDYPTPDGTCIRDFVHVTDLAEAHFLALEYLHSQQTSSNFNLGNNKGYSILQVINTFEKLSGIRVNWRFAERRAGDPAFLVASNEKARNILGWVPRLSDIETILNTAWAWEKNRTY